MDVLYEVEDPIRYFAKQAKKNRIKLGLYCGHIITNSITHYSWNPCHAQIKYPDYPLHEIRSSKILDRKRLVLRDSLKGYPDNENGSLLTFMVIGSWKDPHFEDGIVYVKMTPEGRILTCFLGNDIEIPSDAYNAIDKLIELYRRLSVTPP